MKTSQWLLVILIVLSASLVWASKGALAGTPGDTNGDGNVTMADVVKVQRIVLGMDAPTFGADANRDGKINMGDATYIMRIILGYSPIVGDANGDGRVDMADVTKVQRIIYGLDAPTLGADADRDGLINQKDIDAIQSIIHDFPAK